MCVILLVMTNPIDTATTKTTIESTAPAPSGLTHSKREYDPQYAIFKPNNRGTGGVARFGLSCLKSCVFLETANQSGERQFDWDEKIIMKWGISDLGAVLAVLQRRMPEAKLFHRTDKADTALSLVRQEEKDRAPYLLSISRQSTSDGSAKRMAIPLTHSEVAILEAIIRSAIARILKW